MGTRRLVRMKKVYAEINGQKKLIVFMKDISESYDFKHYQQREEDFE